MSLCMVEFNLANPGATGLDEDDILITSAVHNDLVALSWRVSDR